MKILITLFTLLFPFLLYAGAAQSGENADNNAMERASAARSKRMSANESVFEVVDTKTGTITLNHKN